MTALAKFAREVAAAPHYRQRPVAALQYAYAKWVFRRFRQNDPIRFLQELGIDVAKALDGFDDWRPQLEIVVAKVQNEAERQGGISLDDGMILYGLARALKPAYVIETGVAAGVSTSFFAAALLQNNCGTLFSIELPPSGNGGRTLADGSLYAWQERGAGWAMPSTLKLGLGDRRHLILQDARVALPEMLARLPYVDIFFHDDLHTPDHMFWEYQCVWPKLRPGGVLVSDDVNHGWIKFCNRQGRNGTAFHNVDRLCALRKAGGEEEGAP